MTEIAGPLESAHGVAVDQSTGDVYVSDSAGSRIYRFESDGAPTPTFTLDPSFSSPLAGSAFDRMGSYASALAVDPADGSLLVTDPAKKRIARFDSSGAFVSAFSGFDIPSGLFVDPIDVAVDAGGDIYVIDANGDIVNDFMATSRALRFNSDGSFDTEDYRRVNSPDQPAEPLIKPGAVTVDPHTGYTLIGFNVGAFNGPLIASYDDTTLVGETVFGGIGNMGTLSGLAADPGSSERVYGIGNWVYDCCGFIGVEAFETFELPELAVADSDEVTDTTARLHGSVDPNGFATSWQFEISANGGDWEPVGDLQDAGDGTDPVNVETTANDLQPNTEYSVRLAGRALGHGLRPGSGETFSTNVAAPTVRTSGPNPAAEASIVVGGQVDPNGSQTSYWIEYGTTTDYGSSMPVAEDGDAGAGNTAVTVSQQLTGLEPDTEYHYRLVASNAGGEALGNDQTFTTGALASSGRHFEMITPVDKGGVDSGSSTSTVHASIDGTRVSSMSAVPFSGAIGNGAGSDYFAERDADGWTTRHLTPRVDPDYGAAQSGVSFDGYSDDLGKGLLRSGTPLVPGAVSGKNLYRTTLTDAASASYTLLSPALAEPFTGSDNVSTVFAGGDADLDRVFLEVESTHGLTGDAPDGFVGQPYLFDEGGLRYVGRMPDGSPMADGATIGRGFTDSYKAANRAVAVDGSRAVLSTGSQFTASHVYLWRDGEPTLQVSASRRPDPGFQQAKFLIGSTDLDRVFFSDAAKLTDDATATTDRRDLYMYDASEDSLVDLATADPNGAGAIDVLGASDDGSRLYFLATGRLTPDAVRLSRPDALGDRNLYLWDEEEGLSYITRIEYDEGPFDGHSNAAWSRQQNRKSSRVSRDGETLLFTSARRLTGYDNAGKRQVYLYDAEADAIACASCRPDGAPPAHDATVTTTGEGAQRPRDYMPRFLSDDGEHVFFNTAEDLVAEDTNGVQDAYEFTEGRVRLVSSGRGGQDAYVVDATPDGSQVFFATRGRLSSWDTDELLDLYVARPGASVPDAPPDLDEPPCQGSDCQGAGSGRPAVERPGSLDAAKPEDVASCGSVRLLSKVSASRRRQAARTGRLTISVRHRASGTVAAVATARIGSSRKRVAAGRVRVAQGRVGQLRLVLNRQARARLARTGRLAVSVKTSFSGRCGATRSMRLTLRRTDSSSSGARPARNSTMPIG